MKCSVCKKEFGTGEVCQHCGADKFTALANYSGYETSSNSHGAYNSGTISQSKMASVDSMVCHVCGEIIPASSKFCPYCSCELLVICPKCGKSYSSQYPVCSECGTNRNKYIEIQQRAIEEEKRKQEREDEERLERIKKDIETKQKMRVRTPEGRAELKKEQEQLDRYREYWRTHNKGNTQVNSFKGCFTLLGLGGLFFGILMIFLCISNHGSDNLRINEGKEEMGYVIAVISMIIGFVFLTKRE